MINTIDLFVNKQQAREEIDSLGMELSVVTWERDKAIRNKSALADGLIKLANELYEKHSQARENYLYHMEKWYEFKPEARGAEVTHLTYKW